MKTLVFVFTLAFCLPVFAESDPRLEVLDAMASYRKELLVNKEKVKEELRVEFNLSDKGIDFLMSVREAWMPLDGVDFLGNQRELIQLVSLYLEAEKEWGLPIQERKKFTSDKGTESEKEMEGDFYDFFPQYCSNRIIISGKGQTPNFYRDKYQLDHARKRFVMP